MTYEHYCMWKHGDSLDCKPFPFSGHLDPLRSHKIPWLWRVFLLFMEKLNIFLEWLETLLHCKEVINNYCAIAILNIVSNKLFSYSRCLVCHRLIKLIQPSQQSLQTKNHPGMSPSLLGYSASASLLKLNNQYKTCFSNCTSGD